MAESIRGRKIELLPVTPKENQVLCGYCKGIAWLLSVSGHLETCPHCTRGTVEVCPDCKTPLKKRYSNTCEQKECVIKRNYEQNQKELEKEKARFEKACKVSLKDAPAESVRMMYSELYGYNEGFFSDKEELEDYIEEYLDEGTNMPSYVWGTHVTRISLCAEDIIENGCSDLHDEACERIVYLNELQELLDRWCAKQEGTDSYNVDYSIAILL